MKYKIVEKKNKFAVYAICSTISSARKYLEEILPHYIENDYLSDKNLKSTDFQIIESK